VTWELFYRVINASEAAVESVRGVEIRLFTRDRRSSHSGQRGWELSAAEREIQLELLVEAKRRGKSTRYGGRWVWVGVGCCVTTDKCCAALGE